MGKSEGKRLLGRLRLRCKDIRIDIREIGNEDEGWMHLTQRWWALVNMVINLRVP
jgi:hypothetical protein